MSVTLKNHLEYDNSGSIMTTLTITCISTYLPNIRSVFTLCILNAHISKKKTAAASFFNIGSIGLGSIVDYTEN